MTRCTTWRTRPSSNDPLSTHKRNNCLASRMAFLLVLILVRTDLPLGRHLPGCFLGQAPLIFCRQNLARDRSGSLHQQPADLALEFVEPACLILRSSHAGLGYDVFG